MLHSLGKTNRFQTFLRRVASRSCSDHCRQRNIFQRSQFRQQKVSLENETHFSIAQARLRGRAPVIKQASFEFHRARFRAFQTGERVKQCRFARPGSTAKENRLAMRNLHRNAAQHFNPPRAHSERLEQIARDQLRSHCLHRSSIARVLSAANATRAQEWYLTRRWCMRIFRYVKSRRGLLRRLSMSESAQANPNDDSVGRSIAEVI